MRKCNKCGMKIGVGVKITPLAEAKEKGVPHVESVETAYLVKCSICDIEWCCLECAVEDDAVNYNDFNRGYEGKSDEPFVIKCCHCTKQKRSWE